jgi:hypothetical protein
MGDVLVSIFDYFFQQNAAMTILVSVIAGAAYFAYWKYKRDDKKRKEEIEQEHETRVKYLIDKVITPLSLRDRKNELIKLQMQYADDALDELHGYLYGLYRTSRKEQLEAEGCDTARSELDMDFEVFLHSLILWGVHDRVKSEIRGFFRDNHLASMTDPEFHVYLENRMKRVWTKMVKAIDEYWFGNTSGPNRSDIFDLHDSNKDSILKIIEDVFIEGRATAIKYHGDHETALESNKDVS